MKILVVGMGNTPADLAPGSARVRSGGETKLIEMLKRWPNLGAEITMFCSHMTAQVYASDGLKIRFETLSEFYDKSILGSAEIYLKRILGSVFFKFPKNFNIVFSASDLLYDLLPAVFISRRSGSKLVSCLYLIAPPLFRGHNRTSRGTVFTLSQKLGIWLLKRYADLILVLNNSDKERLAEMGANAKKIKVVSGGIDLNYLSGIRPSEKNYDAAFLGRFHPQKGLFDLIEIWEYVCREEKGRRLALMGGGSGGWVNRLQNEIRERNLGENIDLLLFQDRREIFSVMKSSRCFLFPSLYESWGFVVVEAMACGLPVVAYDLPIFKSIFPEGMIKVSLGNKKQFANIVLDLLRDSEKRKKLSNFAVETASRYDWDRVAEREFQYLRSLLV